MDALTKLNLNSGLAGTTHLMSIIVCGNPSFEEAQSSFLVSFRAPWRLSARIAQEMDRAEITRYIHDHHIPVRLSFVPTCDSVLRASLRGYGFIVDLNAGMGWDASNNVLGCMDSALLHVSTKCMYEHMHLYDPEGHVACGAYLCVEKLLTMLASMQANPDEDFFFTFASFVRLELQPRFFFDVNTGEYRDQVEHLLSVAPDRTCATLLAMLQMRSTSELSLVLRSNVTMHLSVSEHTLLGLIHDSVGASAAPSLHFAIAHGKREPSATRPLPPGMQPDAPHYFLAVWFVHAPGPTSVN